MQAICSAPTVKPYHLIHIPVLIAVTGAEIPLTPAQTRLFMLVTSWIDDATKRHTAVYRWMRRISKQPFELSDDSTILFSRGTRMFADINRLYASIKPVRNIELVVTLHPKLLIFPVKK